MFCRCVGTYLFAFVLIAPVAQAGPLLLEYHDCLMDKTGHQLPDGSYSMRFKIYSDPTRLAPLWESDGAVDVQVTSGCFRYVLGKDKPLPKPMRDYVAVWVGVTMQSGRELSPRTPLNLEESQTTSIHDPGAVVSSSTAAKNVNPYRNEKVFPDLYFHAELSVGLGSSSPGEAYEQYITGWQTGTGFGYGLGLGVGFRNIVQFQYRPRIVTSSDLNRVQQDSVIPLDYHVDNEFVGKVNALCFRKPTSGKVPVLFLTYGIAPTGSVRQVDNVGTGFVEGSSTMIGLEAGILTKMTGVGVHIERRATKFRSFYWQPVGTVEDVVDATFWTFGFHVSVGTGMFF